VNIIKRRVHALSFSLFLSALLAGAISVPAEQLPIKTYTTADGLARDTVNHIIQDSHGFLWFATSEGLSRFDGYRFTNYGPEQGLPNRLNNLMETRDGVLWIATDDGLYRFNPNGVAQPLASLNSDGNQGQPTEGAGSTPEPMFVAYDLGESKHARDANVLLEDHAGVVWCGTGEVLYRLERKDETWQISRIEIGLPEETLTFDSLTSLAEGTDNSLWIGAVSGLYRLRPDGRPERYTTHEGLPDNHITAVLKDKSGRVWAGTLLGLCLLVADPEPNQQIVARVYTDKDGLIQQGVHDLFQTSDGKLLASSNGLCELDLASSSDAQRFRCYAKAQGLPTRLLLLLKIMKAISGSARRARA
jgi:ligand-binding sensor domain-containing protein